ncbi:MAG: hypothetical protein ACI8WB_004745, partial [Phenylobacterium sp.]
SYMQLFEYENNAVMVRKMSALSSYEKEGYQ